MAEWFADEEFWKTSFPFMFAAQNIGAAGAEIASLLGFPEIHHPRTVLDLGTGPGRHAVVLAKAGLKVTGVDLSAFLLERARERAMAEDVDIEWVQQSMLEFARPEFFDLALCLFTSFGFFDTDEENRRVLANVCQSLRPGGTFVLDVMGKETLARIFQPASVSVRPGIGKQVCRRTFAPGLTRMENEWTFLLESGEVKEFSFRHWVYSAHELQLMLRDVGFASADVYGDFEGRPYDMTSSRLIAVARRAE